MVETITLNPTGNARIRSSVATTNYQDVFIGELNSAASIQRSFLTFNFSSIPNGAFILSATLRLRVMGDYASTDSYLNVYRLLVDYVANQVTWNIRKTGTNWATAGGFSATDCELTEIGSVATSASESVGSWK